MPIIALPSVRLLRPVTAAALALLLAGCSEPKIDNGPQYPPVVQSGVRDVQVLRDETQISMTNTAAADLPAGLLWINGWYALPFAGLHVGKSVTLQLSEFKDRYGDSFRAGGFFATELPDRLVLAQIQPVAVASAGEESSPAFETKLIGLIVIRPFEEASLLR